jgi:hypothetical protein
MLQYADQRKADQSVTYSVIRPQQQNPVDIFQMSRIRRPRSFTEKQEDPIDPLLKERLQPFSQSAHRRMPPDPQQPGGNRPH